MPYYEYECIACGHRFEALQTFEEHDRHEDHEQHHLLTCPNCGCQDLEQHLAPVFVITSRKS